MGKENILVSLDIGTSKITTLVGDIDDSGDLHIIGFGETPSKGIEKGIIIKPNDVINAIRKSIDIAEDVAGTKISGVIANVSGYHLECRNDSEKIEFDVPQKAVTQMDISQLIEKVSSKIQPQKENMEVIHIIPKKYILDDEDEVIDPIGLVASKIEGRFHIVLDKINAYTNLKKVIEAAGLRVIDFIANPVASSTAVLYSEEKDMGVLVLDIGAGTTDMAVYKDGSLEYIKSFPVGGNQVTMDIAHRFKVSREEAESLKLEYGAALTEVVENESVEVFPRGSDEPIEVNLIDLVDTIEARLVEIFELVKSELTERGYMDKINAGVVLTGGVSNTLYIKELASDVLGKDVRIGKPKNYSGFSDKIAYPQYSTSIGMLLFARNKVVTSSPAPVHNSSGFDFIKFGKSIIDKIKSIF